MYCNRDKKIYKAIKKIVNIGCEDNNPYGVTIKNESDKTYVGDILYNGEKRGIKTLIIKTYGQIFEINDIPIIEVYKNKKTSYVELPPISKTHLAGNLLRIEC